jgi:hypothetical protein
MFCTLPPSTAIHPPSSSHSSWISLSRLHHPRHECAHASHPSTNRPSKAKRRSSRVTGTEGTSECCCVCMLVCMLCARVCVCVSAEMSCTESVRSVCGPSVSLSNGVHLDQQGVPSLYGHISTVWWWWCKGVGCMRAVLCLCVVWCELEAASGWCLKCPCRMDRALVASAIISCTHLVWMCLAGYTPCGSSSVVLRGT